jgi:VanZ family protein
MNGARVDRHLLLRWLPALAWMGLIFLLSSQSGLAVSKDVSVERPLRGIAHLLTFGTLAGLLLFAFGGIRRPTLRDLGLAFVLTALYGVSDEWHQSMVPTRSARVEDWLIDVAGALIGLGVTWLLLSTLAGRRARPRPGTPDVDARALGPRSAGGPSGGDRVP